MAETQKRFILARASAWNAEGFNKSLYNDSIVFIHNGETNAAPGKCVAIYTKGVEYPVGKALSGETITKAFAGNGTVTYTTTGTKLDGTNANITALSFKQGDNIEITVDEAGALVIKGKDWSEEIANAVAGVDTDFVKEVKESTTNGSILVDGTDVPVHGLASAAFVEASTFATAEQGDKADSALQAADIATGDTNGTIKVKGTDVTVAGLGTAAYKAEDYFYTAEQGAAALKAANDAADAASNAQDTADQAVEDAATALAAAGTAETNAKSHADGLNSAITTRVDGIEDRLEVIEGKDYENKVTDVQVNGVSVLEGTVANVVTNTAYNASTNKLATMQDVTTAVAGLSGAMHFIGVSTTNPETEGATVGDVTTFISGDVVLFGNSEYVYNGTSWIELGTEGDYAVKGSIKNADISADAAIEQSKIANLTESLASAKTKVEEKSTGFVTVTKATGDNGEDVYTVTESDIASAEALANLTTEVSENEEVVAQALVNINGRLDGIDTTISGLDLGVTSVKASTSSNHVTVTPTEAAKGEVTLNVDVASVNATDTTTYVATGLATDAYVNEKVATAVSGAEGSITLTNGTKGEYVFAEENAGYVTSEHMASIMNEAWAWGEI